MPERHLLAIPLPHGREADRGSLTVYFAPRLRERGPLSDYPEWVDWPTRVNAMTINVFVNGVPRNVVRVTPLAEPAAWRAVFAPDTPVSGHRPKDWRRLADKALEVGPGGDFSEALLGLYAAFARTYPTAPPPGDEALTLPEAEVLGSSAIDDARRYVTPLSDDEHDRIEEPRDPQWDFHEYVSLLGHHPQLLRILGLAVELEVDLPTAPSTVRVHTNYDNGTDRRAVDFVIHTTPDFWAKPNPDPTFTEQDGGFLRLAEQGAFESILDVLSSADRVRGLDDRLPGRLGTLPALRTRALTLVRPDLVTAFRNRTVRQWTIEEDIADALAAAQPQPVTIFAEDVTIGHRIDVLEPAVDKAVWRSLFERQTDDAGYQFPADPALDRVPDPDEGWTTTTLATELDETFDEPDPDNHDPFVPTATRRLDDQLYRWDGWSGAVPRPGRAVDGPTGTAVDKDVDLPPSGDPVQFAAGYEVVPGSLPRLRFGTEYLMRARCVDLSGDSRSLDTPAPATSLPPVETFGRLEPIAAPFVVRRQPRPAPGVGDDALTVVLRSDYHVDDVDVKPQERLLFPGQVGQDLCELHGQPDGGVDPDSYRLLANRDVRDPADRWDIDPVTGEGVASGRRRQLVQYLSDPLIGRLRGFDHGHGTEHLATIAGTWPAVNSARVHVVAGDAATETNPDDVTELRVGVGKAEITTIDLSYAPAEGCVEEFGLWHQLDAAVQEQLRPVIENGGHWMFSARAPLQIVHAVRRPLLPPQIVTWLAERGLHSTGVTFTADVEIDRKSTERLTLDARWVDLVDDLGLPGPVPRAGGAPLGRFLTPRDPAAEPRFAVADHRAELGDTRRHAATIDLEAFSWFSSYFTEQRSGAIGFEPTVITRKGFAAGTVAVTASDGTAAAEGADYVVDHAAGTVAAVRGGRFADGDAATVRYVPLPVSRTSNEPELTPFEFVFPSTKAPPPPRVVDVVPAFARTRSTVDGGTDLVHDGNVVRVYFARPWNVSGDGEAVAVLVERTPGPVPAASCVGRDPIVTGTTTALTAAALSRATSVAVSPDGVHDLAIHDVEYDPESSRWFADIAVDTPMYRPFLRLVLARYQADSIAGEELSPTVVLEPQRLGVSRTVSVRDLGADVFDVTVVGADHGGMTADDGTGTLLVNELVVVHQRADATITDVDLRWQVDVATIELPRVSSNGVTTWAGAVSAPADGGPRRLLVEEREPALTGGAIPVTGGQVVYSEVIEL